MGKAERRRDRMRLRVDQRQSGVTVLVLQRPELSGDGVELQSVDRSRQRIGVFDLAGLVVLNDRARTARSGGIRAVAVFDKGRAVSRRDRVGLTGPIDR